MQVADFPIGAMIRYYGEVETDPVYVVSHEPPKISHAPHGQGCLATTQFPIFDWPELKDVVETLGIDIRMLTVED